MTGKLPKATKLPRFKSREEEAEFFDTHDVSELPGKEAKLKAVRPLKHVIQMEIDRELLSALVAHAQAQGVPFSQLVQRWVREGLEREAPATETGDHPPTRKSASG